MKTNNKLQQVRRSLLATLLAFGYFSIGLAPAYASDTEVYSASATTPNNAPMVMLNLDASSSMAACIDPAVTSCPGNRRIDALKRAMKKVLKGNAEEIAAGSTEDPIAPAPGYLRVGMSIIQAAGNAASEGWKVRHPVRRLDDIVNNITVTKTIASANDNVEHNSSGGGGMNHDSELNLASLSPAYVVGMRFPTLDVPRGASITEAYIEFTASATTSGDPAWLLKSEASDDANDYSSNGPGSNSRTYNDVGTIISNYNSRAVDVTEPDPTIWTAGKKYQVLVTDQVQAVVNRTGWCGDNAIAFSLENSLGANTNTRRVYSYEGALAAGNAGLAPTLVVKYTMSAAAAANTCFRKDFTQVISVGTDGTGTTELNDVDWREDGTNLDMNATHSTLLAANVSSNKRLHIGLRFPGVLADAAHLTAARLYLEKAASCSTNNCTLPTLEVAAFKPASGSMPVFCTSASACTKPAEGGSDLTSSSDWAVGVFDSGSPTTFSKDVTAMVRDVMNGPWASGNAIGFRIRNKVTTSTSTGAFYAYQTSAASKAPRLELTYRGIVTNATTVPVKTVRDELLDTVNSLVAQNNPPGANTYLESSRYLLGEMLSSKAVGFSDPSTYVSETNRKYITPINSSNQCSGNYMFYMSAGIPDSSSQTNNVYPVSITCDNTSTDDIPAPAAAPTQGWDCSFNAAKYLSSGNGVFRSPSGATTRATVRTNTMVFGKQPAADATGYTDYVQSVTNMANLAKMGGGIPYTAKSEADLLTALEKTLEGALDEGASISAPGVAVNQLSRLNHLDELYYSVFDPDPRVDWKGNVKRYKLGVNSSGVPTVYDSQVNASGQSTFAAIDPVTSFFKKEAISWWTDPSKPDGRVAKDGGSASKMPLPANRRMYTYLSTYPTISSSTTPVDLERINPPTPTNLSNTFNTTAKGVIGVSDDTQYSNYMNWLLGYDITNFSSTVAPSILRSQTGGAMGGALHSRPLLVNYGYSGDVLTAVTNSAQQENVVYFSTLEGVLHAINTRDGVEQFSFIPKERLARLKTLADNPVGSEPEYGMDLSWTILREDNNGDLQITTGGSPASNDRVWMFGGMRMGGSNYYALDVTDRNAPKLKWVLEGGATDTPFENMGQTWSQPALGKVKINGVSKTVLFFGGGYDTDHESLTYLPTSGDDKGNQLYIVDADTGQVIWWASSTDVTTASPRAKVVSDLKFSVPSEIKTFDYNFDGLVDTLYFGDLGGQVFRVDLNNATTTNSNLVKRVRLLAKLGQTAVATPGVTDQRRFYEAPSVARFNDASGKYVMVAMGTGNRSHPLQGKDATDTNIPNDYFFVMRDNDVTKADILTGNDTSLSSGSLQTPYLPGNLADVNLGLVNVTGGVVIGGLTSAPNGWKGDLPDRGEKVLASPIIFSNKVFFTTYVPVVVDSNPCRPEYGRTKLYEVGVVNAALTDTNNDGRVTTADSPVTDNVVQGLGGEAQLIVLPPNISGSNCGPIVLVGTNAQCSGEATSGGLKRLRWYNKTKN